MEFPGIVKSSKFANDKKGHHKNKKDKKHKRKAHKESN